MAPPTQVEVSIATTSQVMDSNNFPPLALPKITMNGNPFPAPTQPSGRVPCGLQLVVINSTADMTDPANILLNAALMLPTGADGLWVDTYTGLWDGMTQEVLDAGNIEDQLVFVVTYGLDANMPPSVDGLDLLLNRGAGAQLQGWETSVNPGSMSNDFISIPANYVLVGNSEYGYGEGTEKFDNPGGSGPVETIVTVTLDNPVPPS